MDRKKDKIEMYLKKIVTEANGTIIEARHSSYYNINGKILRVSDHIGANSSGNMSVIIPGYSCRKDDYIIHAHQGGEITIVDYERLKEICRSFVYMAAVFNSMIQTKFEFEVEVKERFDAVQEEKGVNAELERLRKKQTDFEKLLGKFKKLKQDYKTLQQEKMSNNDYKDYILGAPVSIFTEGQLTCIRSTVTNVLKKQMMKG